MNGNCDFCGRERVAVIKFDPDDQPTFACERCCGLPNDYLGDVEGESKTCRSLKASCALERADAQPSSTRPPAW